MNTTCDREEDVLEAVMSGQWPRVPGNPGNNLALRQHVDGCPSCRDLVTVATALRDEHELASRDAHLPTFGPNLRKSGTRGTPFRTAALGLPVDGSVITGNRASIASKETSLHRL